MTKNAYFHFFEKRPNLTLFILSPPPLLFTKLNIKVGGTQPQPAPTPVAPAPVNQMMTVQVPVSTPGGIVMQTVQVPAVQNNQPQQVNKNSAKIKTC